LGIGAERTTRRRGQAFQTTAKKPPGGGLLLRAFRAAFRNLCIDPSVEMRPVFSEQDTVKTLFSGESSSIRIFADSGC
jgi:hypothetical protein